MKLPREELVSESLEERPRSFRLREEEKQEEESYRTREDHETRYDERKPDESTLVPTKTNIADTPKLQIGQELGTGMFARVHAVSLRDDLDATDPPDNNNNTPRMLFAMKCIRRSIRDKYSPSSVKSISIDLEKEGKLLSELSHPNIVKLYSTHEIPSDRSLGATKQILLLERLFGTVQDRLSVQVKKSSLQKIISSLSLLFLRRRHFSNMQTRQREIAVPIASALTYLHSRRIIYRDLKLDNIGVDANGTVKLFDFGLARELPSNPDVKMTRQTGAFRYMAPEVFKGQHYNLSADVYSFGLILWEISSLLKPFGDVRLHDLRREVFYGSKRPKVNRRCCGSRVVQWMLHQCWRINPNERPTMEDVYHTLELEISLEDE